MATCFAPGDEAGVTGTGLSLELAVDGRRADLECPADGLPAPGALPARLQRLGLPRHVAVTLTRNRTVVLSWRARTGLRLHAGYAGAPDHVLIAIVRFVARRVPRAERLAARRIFMAFPAHQHAPSRPERPRTARPATPEDQRLIDRLMRWHVVLNARHFAAALTPIPIRVSDRMRRRLGELRATRSGAAAEIIISRRHIGRHGWEAALDTLLHEMVHQWQAEQGHPLDHGCEFRRKAGEVGIVPRAVADLKR
ncbi:MAG: SprT-like domain-containing protein [Gemmatimonadales bacterium]